MPQVQLKQPYTVVTACCSHCQQEQVVHTQARGGIWSVFEMRQEFVVVVPDAIIGGPFLPERPAGT